MRLQKDGFFCQIFRYNCLYHHQWLNKGKERERELYREQERDERKHEWEGEKSKWDKGEQTTTKERPN